VRGKREEKKGEGGKRCVFSSFGLFNPPRFPPPPPLLPPSLSVDEYTLVDALKAGTLTKPVVAWVSGTCAPLFKSEVQFGHAGARSGGLAESAAAKNDALRAAGAVVPDSFEGLEAAVKKVYDGLVADGTIVPKPKPTPPSIPTDLKTAMKSGLVRVPTNIVSTICDDRGDEPTYCGVGMQELVSSGATVGDAISLLWFKRRLPPYAVRFIEMVVVLCADHG
jgi:ATP citrate (pro-S)-lyase